jgi:drug/metabolite transporter (DMT)-like permease
MHSIEMHSGLLYGITVLIWGSTWLAIKFQLGVVSPEMSIAYRFLFAAAILLIYSTIRRLPMRYGRKAHAFMALQGLFLFSLNYIMVYLAEGYLTSGFVAIIFSMIIVMNVFLGAVILKNPVKQNVVFGAVIGLIGLGLVFGQELASFQYSREKLMGFVLAIIGMISASFGNIISARNQRDGLPVIQTNAFGMSYGALITLGVAVLRGAKLEFDPSVGYVVSFAYLAIFGSVIAFGTYLTLLGRIGPDRAAYVSVMFPIIALILSTMYEGLTWTPTQLIGCVFVVIGNAIVLNRVRLTRAEKGPNAA